jgi:hypothetical protein
MRATSRTAIRVNQNDMRSTLGNNKSKAIQSRRMCPLSQTRTSTQKVHNGQSLGYARSTRPKSPTVRIISSSRLAGKPIRVLDQAITTPAATNPIGIPHPLLVKYIAFSMWSRSILCPAVSEFLIEILGCVVSGLCREELSSALVEYAPSCRSQHAANQRPNTGAGSQLTDFVCDLIPCLEI